MEPRLAVTHQGLEDALELLSSALPSPGLGCQICSTMSKLWVGAFGDQRKSGAGALLSHMLGEPLGRSLIPDKHFCFPRSPQFLGPQNPAEGSRHVHIQAGGC